jgi:putative Mg2+ transporter-C (MgtC) family protein
MPTSEILLRLGAATLAGAALGLNRKLRGKAAGLRTHALVALGAALVVLVSDVVAANDRGAVTRAVQGIVAGVGFLGGGTILKSRAGIRGLTTAASIWIAACVGVACGAGLWVAAAIAVGLALAVLIGGGPTEKAVRRVTGRPAPNHDVTGVTHKP